MKKLRTLFAASLFLSTAFAGNVWSDSYLSDVASCMIGDITIGYDDFRSLPDGSWNNNTGALIGANFAAPVYATACYDFGVQLGGSWGVYDWAGRGSQPSGNFKNVQQQGFVTVGAFALTNACSGFNFGVAYDWMGNRNFSVYALDPNFSQIRFLGSYLYCCSDEFGLWGTAHVQTSHNSSQGVPVNFRSINQINAFWRHQYENCAETVVWAGVPYSRSLSFESGLAGRFIMGASFEVPLNDCWSVYGRGSYMFAKHQPDRIESRNDAMNICIGLNYAFGSTGEFECADCGCSGCGCGFRALFPVANNSNFISDTSINF